MKKTQWNFTHREIEILKLVICGKSNKAISKVLYISDSTVKAHLSKIYQKFGVENRTEAAMKARDNNIIPLQDSEQP